MITSLLETSAALWPTKTALVCAGARHSYRELDERANRLANQLIGLGVVRGDRVAIWLENSVEAVIAFFAISKAGAVFLPIHCSTKTAKVTYILEDCAARVIITCRADFAIPAVHVVTEFDPNACNARPPVLGIDLDLAALIYTSGSSGKPKGVMLTHLNMETAVRSINAYLDNQSSDVIIGVLPLSFDYGLYQLLITCLVGATLVLEKSFAYPWALIEIMRRENVTGLPLVPTLAALLLQMDLSRCSLPSLRYITNTAASLPVAHIEALRIAFPGVAIYSMYGLTECKRATYLPPEELSMRPGSVGRAIPNTEVYLVDPGGNKLAHPAQGALVVRGAHVMKGYWNLPAETARMLRDGPLPGEKVLHTGDIFRSDAEGYLYFLGRTDDIIKSRGEKVSPREVEGVLCHMPQIAEAAVTGVADPILGQAIAAFVVAQPGIELLERHVWAYCRSRLEDFMVPKQVNIVPYLPRSPNGKIDWRSLGVSK